MVSCLRWVDADVRRLDVLDNGGSVGDVLDGRKGSCCRLILISSTEYYFFYIIKIKKESYHSSLHPIYLVNWPMQLAKQSSYFLLKTSYLIIFLPINKIILPKDVRVSRLS